MNDVSVDIVATTISGSIQDWSKIEKIIPEFKRHGFSDQQATLHKVDSHAEARRVTARRIQEGSRIIISAGGSGTFNSVLEGCCDSGVALSEITLGFLRKGSADLLGKALGMPDEIEPAIKLFAECIREKRTTRCDVLSATSEAGDVPRRHFVGYGGAEIFGRIPYITESRFKKYYKGILSGVFGDLGPFFVGMSVATLIELPAKMFGRKRRWAITVDGQHAGGGCYQALIIVNGDLGPDLPFARSKPLGSGEFYVFGLRDIGLFKMIGQIKHAWDASILDDPERWGLESYSVKRELRLQPSGTAPFPLNVDGSSMKCLTSATVVREGYINVFCASLS